MRPSRRSPAPPFRTEGDPALLRDAALIERDSCLGRGGVTVSIAAGQDVQGVPPEIAFALGRSAKEEEQMDLAEILLRRALESPDRQLRARADAHIAHLSYYRGLFVDGLDRATRAADGAFGLARLEALLYASVNATALNRSAHALALAERARQTLRMVKERVLRDDARLRVSRQLAHVYVARGEYVRATAEAESAAAAARRLGSDRGLGISAYIRGYVDWARGDQGATAYLRRAAILWGGTHHAFGRWTQFVWGLALRDAGDASAGRGLQAASRISLPWEEPLFALALGEKAEVPEIAGAPVDELPFREAARGIVFLAKGDAERATQALASAAAEFERCELDHYRRGATLNLAAAHIGQGDRKRALTILRRETPALIEFGLRRWPWWYPPAVVDLANLASMHSIGARHWTMLASSVKKQRPALRSLLVAQGLSSRECEVVERWLEHPEWSRRMLSRALGISEASVRNHLGRVRRKLGVVRERGAEALHRRLLRFQDTGGWRFV
ncbi:MAG: LuxR C-terminal-related transcriptional regulator [Candidatus Limnocylindria bacterium]